MNGAVLYRRYDFGLLVSATLAWSGIESSLSAHVQPSSLLFIRKCPGAVTHSGPYFIHSVSRFRSFYRSRMHHNGHAGLLIICQTQRNPSSGFLMVSQSLSPNSHRHQSRFPCCLSKKNSEYLITFSTIFANMIINTSNTNDLMKYFSFPLYET